jgi:Carboxypeptidase regulatory-like domain
MQRGAFARLTACRPEADEVQTYAKQLLLKRRSGSARGAKASRAFPLVVVAVIVLALCAPSIWGQAVATGTVLGTVTDNTGAVVAGVNVTLIDKATGDSRTTATNDVGHYIFQNVSPSTYVLKFKKPGFEELDIASLTVEVGTQLTENAQLKLGAVSTTVAVT